jgi:hypothetical protein
MFVQFFVFCEDRKVNFLTERVAVLGNDIAEIHVLCPRLGRIEVKDSAIGVCVVVRECVVFGAGCREVEPYLVNSIFPFVIRAYLCLSTESVLDSSSVGSVCWM